MPFRKRGRTRKSAKGSNRRLSQRNKTAGSDTEIQDDTQLDDTNSDAIDESEVATPLVEENDGEEGIEEEAGSPVDNNKDDDEVMDESEENDDEEEDDDEDDLNGTSTPIVSASRRRDRRNNNASTTRSSRAGTNDDAASSDNNNTPSASTTSNRRRGGFRGGARGRSRFGVSSSTNQVSRGGTGSGPVDKEGKLVAVVDNEADLPEDAEGETKVDKNGKLQGNRDYRVRVFTIRGQGDGQLYMLSTEPARCTGFRDSYLFFNKHVSLYKVVLDEHEKMDLIERGILPHSYKGRSIGVVTARSVFREFGARIIVAGRKIIDDYYVTEARERGDVEGELADVQDRMPGGNQPYNKNQYVAWHGASQVYHKEPVVKDIVVAPPTKQSHAKRKINLTTINWQSEHAFDASKFNSSLLSSRRSVQDGTYDIYSNTMHFPKTMQPTHAKWSAVPSSSGSLSSLMVNNFLTTDLRFQSARHSNLGVPGPDGDVFDVLPCTQLRNVPRELLAELPSDCRGAFEKALREEMDWKGQWGLEARDCLRGGLRIGYAGFPV